MADKLLNSLPLILGGSSLLCTGILGAIVVAAEEEKEYVSQLQVAAEVIASSLVDGCRRKRPSKGVGGACTRRRFIHWDRERAVTCMNQDYLGAIPSFGLDDFKHIFRVLRSSYDAIQN
jgi:hypothetical protein